MLEKIRKDDENFIEKQQIRLRFQKHLLDAI